MHVGVRNEKSSDRCCGGSCVLRAVLGELGRVRVPAHVMTLAIVALVVMLAVPAYKCAAAVWVWWVGRNGHRIGD